MRFVSRLGCVLSQDPLRFDSRLIAFCLKTLLRFVSRLGCVLSHDLLRFVSRLTAFCLKNCCARDLLTLQTPKKKSPADQYIFQRRTSTPTGSSGHDESSSLYAELGLTDSVVESDEDMPGIDAGVQGEGQTGPNPNAQDEGQAGPNPDEQAEGQAGPNPGMLKHVSTQPYPEHIDEGFTATAYPKGPCLLYNTLQKTSAFGDIFFNDKPSKADNEKTIAEIEAELMVSVTIQQDTSSIPPMKTPIIDLTSRPESPNVHQLLKATATETTTTTITIHPPPSQPQQSSTDSMLMKRIGELEHIMANLIQGNKYLEERLDSHGARLYILENLDKPQQMSKAVDEVHAKRRKRDVIHQKRHQPPPPPPPAGLSGASGSLEAFGSSQVPPPPPPPPSINQEGQSQGSAAPSSSKTAASAEYQAWTMTDTRLRPSVSLTPADLQMDDDMAPDAQAQSSDDEDIENAHIPKNNWASALAFTYSPPVEDSLLAQTGDITMFMDWFCKRQGITELKPQDLEVPAFEIKQK
uniref:Uncharacterized protein n=1 Tax=Tanacetum cinerariifolium TaxID=118510 RepID=A0A6L2LB79_TANCI|nr:hypothetical protein [Tanacetum cinerariifolium]